MEAPLELLEEATETLIKSKHKTTDDVPALFFGFFVLFDIWEEFNRLVPELDRAVKVCISHARSPVLLQIVCRSL